MALPGLSFTHSNWKLSSPNRTSLFPPTPSPLTLFAFSSPSSSSPKKSSIGVDNRIGTQRSKRMVNLSILSLLLSAPLSNLSKAVGAEELELETYTDSQEGFTLLRPSSWIEVDKAGATVLFEDVNKGANNVGVVVSPVRLTTLGEFGSPQFVADKLLQAEKRKVSVSFFLCSWNLVISI
ncbi:hypothetical protein RJ639_004816 [Escallonia herrerae]|uniref:PsbP C-terminal domain-containing protein n=1 Tax=Escallonia herrerae TaxID=1293975 RepID=A0AA88W1A9_9ASTE|nr:hypothetical protein RJ639_004816 [Escallonia herrerae]